MVQITRLHSEVVDQTADKLEAQKQWDTDPCGASTAGDQEMGTLEFYRDVRAYRYNDYGPWFDRVMKFSKVHGKDVLEIGSGLGSDHYRFAVAGNQMTALDLSQEHLRHTQRHLSLEGLGTKLVYGDAEALPFEDNSFDIVYSFGVLHHTPGTQQALNEVHRVLRPGGTAIIGLYHRDSFFYWLQTMLMRGVLRRELWSKGYRRMMADIEYRSDPDSAVPLVKVYSRGQVRRMLARFGKVRLTTCHVDIPHTGPFAILVGLIGRERVERFLPRQRLERFLGWGGWYVVARAVKH